jgi:hypothetical protein
MGFNSGVKGLKKQQSNALKTYIITNRQGNYETKVAKETKDIMLGNLRLAPRCRCYAAQTGSKLATF